MVIIEDVLQKREESFPARDDVLAMIPNSESAPFFASIPRSVITFALVQRPKFTRILSRTIEVQLNEMLDQVDALRSRPKALEEYVEERKRTTEACNEVRFL